MARITIEDCMEKVPNRFHLVQMASIRAKQLKKGARPLLSSDENKHVVMALREIAAGLVKPGEATPEPTVLAAAPEVGKPGPDVSPFPGAEAAPISAANPADKPASSDASE